MEEKVRRRPTDRKPTKVNRKRRGPHWGSHPPSPTLPSTMLWLTRSASARLTLFSIRQGGPGTSNIVDGGCKGVCHGNCGRHLANRWDLSVWSRRLTFLSTTGTVDDYKWNRYSTMGCKLQSQKLLAPAHRIVIALLSEMATRTLTHVFCTRCFCKRACARVCESSNSPGRRPNGVPDP